MSKHASEQDIKKAYKRLSRKYHPDKNNDPGAEDKFVEVAHGRFDGLSCLTFNIMGICSIRSTFGCDRECHIDHLLSKIAEALQKRQIYDRHGEVRAILCTLKCSRLNIYLQEGLKAHEGGQHHTNPFDMFSSFFGGGRWCLLLWDTESGTNKTQMQIMLSKCVEDQRR